ncbi:MAG: lysozyme inhibitor LprI family protein [Burkholderiales bacterium]
MKKLLLIVILLSPLVAKAQYNGPALDACRAFAKKEAAREGMSVNDVVLERDASLAMERYARKVGGQLVGSILTGNGAVVLPGSPSAELSFICLLADDKRPLFFNWLPRQNVAALAQCRRSPEVRAQTRSCLEFLLRTAEMDLSSAYANRFQEANQRGEQTLAAYRKSNDEWREYRDAECARRRDYAVSGVAPEDLQLACIVELTRRRGLDMR